MPPTSAGLLVYRRAPAGAVEVLLVHPGGPYWVNKDLGAWTIPKGGLEAGESERQAAEREFREETGWDPPRSEMIELGTVRTKAGKVIHAFACEGDFDAAGLRSITMRMEFPARSGKYIEVPEIDRAGWFTLDKASRRINPRQAPLLERLAKALGEAWTPGGEGGLFG